jgi:hypothetical protein
MEGIMKALSISALVQATPQVGHSSHLLLLRLAIRIRRQLNPDTGHQIDNYSSLQK